MGLTRRRGLDFMMPPRGPLEQTFFNFTVVVGTVPTPIAPTIDISSMIQSFSICNSQFNANPVYFGDAGVTSSSAGVFGTGIEIVPGTTRDFLIQEDRQLYELQDPELLSLEVAACQKHDGIAIPVICWRLSQCFLICAAATITVSIQVFRNIYV
jgi:hypothetical protein